MDETRNSNIEIRNRCKSLEMNNLWIFLFGTFDFWSFGIVSKFGFRASDLDMLGASNFVTVLATNSGERHLFGKRPPLDISSVLGYSTPKSNGSFGATVTLRSAG